MNPDIRVESLVVGINAENTYIVHVEGQSTAVCIDPGDDVEAILALAEQRAVAITKILITHAHWDHINDVGKLKQHTGARIYCHRADMFLYERVDEQAYWMGAQAEKLPQIDHFVEDGEVIEEGALRFMVLHTPGHSPGGVCYLIDEVCFVGDTIFAQSIGRCDLPGGDEQKLLVSIREKILTLPDSTVLYPGHGPKTTVGDERELNPFLH